MKILGLDGETYNLKYNKVPEGLEKSAGHKLARDLITNIFPLDNVFEEVTIPGTKLKIDIFLPLRRLCIEIHGKQHYEYCEYFHGSVCGFEASKNRDCLKRKWCGLNNIVYLELDSRNTSKWKGFLSEFYKYDSAILPDMGIE